MRTPIGFAALLSLTLVASVYSAEKAAPKQPTISNGMKLTEALSILRSQGIEAEELFRAVAHRNPQMQLREYLIHPKFPSCDALIVAAEAPLNATSYVVADLEWYLNWHEEGRLPRGLRSYKSLHLESLDLTILQDLPAELKRMRRNYKPPDPNDDPFGTE